MGKKTYLTVIQKKKKEKKKKKILWKKKNVWELVKCYKVLKRKSGIGKKIVKAPHSQRLYIKQITFDKRLRKKQEKKSCVKHRL